MHIHQPFLEVTLMILMANYTERGKKWIFTDLQSF